jgi:hypothetical protein
MSTPSRNVVFLPKQKCPVLNSSWSGLFSFSGNGPPGPSAFFVDQAGNLDIVIGEAHAFMQPDFQIQELFAVDILRDAETRSFRSRVPLNRVLLEGYRRQTGFLSETGRVGLTVCVERTMICTPAKALPI